MIGPSAIDSPNTLPHAPIAFARSFGSVNVQRAERDQRAQGRREAARQRADGEHREPDLEHAAAAHPVRGRSGQHQQARDHEQVRVDRPLQPGDGRAEVSPDRGDGHVDDRDVQPDDEQAQAADGQHQVAAPTAQLRQYGSLGRGPGRGRHG
jgi:hypothetical protein